MHQEEDGRVLAVAGSCAEGQRFQEAARARTVGDHRELEDAAERAHDDHGPQEQDDVGSLRRRSEQVLQGGVGLEEEANEELRMFTEETVKPERRVFSDTSRVWFETEDGRCQQSKALKLKLDLQERQY